MSDDISRLVEQARETLTWLGDDTLLVEPWGTEVADLLAGLADAVEQLQATASLRRDAAAELSAQRDEARARVAALEAGIQTAIYRIGRTLPGSREVSALRALLDGGEVRS